MAAKLTLVMKTPGQAVELLVSFHLDSNPPAGTVRDRTGHEQRFSGWLGLLGLLETHCQNPARGAMTTTHQEIAMSATSNDIAPIALQEGEGEARWFLGFLVTIKASTESTRGAVAVIEHLGPRGTGSPLHVHHNEDEWFYVMQGELTFCVGGEVISAREGSFVYGPRDIPHTFTVSSETARFLLVTEPAGFESFMRTFSEPATELVIPPAPTEPPDVAAMTRLAAEYRIEILGPPGIPT